MRHFIIDGNNLIGKIDHLWKLQSKNKKESREKLAFAIERYFSNRNHNVTLHFDGHKDEPIKTNFRIEYSDNRSADEMIKQEISISNNPRLISVITSDHNLAEFARVCGCEVIKSENFGRGLFNKNSSASENELINKIDNNEIKRLFGV